MKSLVILASGAGSNAERIIEYLKGSSLHTSIELITDRLSSGVFDIAERHGVSVEYMPYATMEGGGLMEKLRSIDPDLIVLAGFLRKIPLEVVRVFEGSMINLHPSLLPKYGGKGMYGEYVHQAVLASNDKESGITIHYVNEEFDQGGRIAQFFCPLDKNESLQSLKLKIQQLEHRYFPYVIETILDK